MSHVAHTYAAALLELARESDSAAEVGAELAAVAEALMADPAAAAFLRSSRIGRAAKSGMLERVFRGDLNDYVYGLLMLLCRRGRLRLLREIATAYHDKEEAGRGIQHVVVSTAIELDGREVERVRSSLQASLGRTVLLETHVDPTLIAGIRVQTEGTEYELSIDGLLRRLGRRLTARAAERAI